MRYAVRNLDGSDIAYFETISDAERWLVQALLSQKFKLGKVVIETLKKTTCPTCGATLHDHTNSMESDPLSS